MTFPEFFSTLMVGVSITLETMSPNDIVWDLITITVEVFSERVAVVLQCPALSGMDFIKNFLGH